VLQACQELGVGFVAFSSVGRKYFGGLDTSSLHEKDIRRSMSRFSGDNWLKNLALLPPMQNMANQLGVTLAQLALAWVLHQGEHIVSIPGTTSEQHMRDNLAAQEIALNIQQLQQLNAMINRHNVSGARYDAQSQSEVDTEHY
jgi:aryl-alcohol dehydrogenase-like predicted oxidoreductase